MSVFTYYLPGQTVDAVTPDSLRAIGLGDRLADCLGKAWVHLLSRLPVANHGPDGKSGLMIVPNRTDNVDTPLYKPGAWDSTISDNGQFWICWQKADLPGPAGLRRRKLVEGLEVELLDGRSWHCPTIRRALAFPGLPCSFSRVNGEVKKEVIPAYRDLWEQSAGWAAEAFGGGLTESKLFDICARCLAVNYRLADEELRVLGLFDNAAMEGVVKAALDYQFFADCATDEKKRMLRDSLFAAASSSPGSADSTPDTEFRAAS